MLPIYVNNQGMGLDLYNPCRDCDRDCEDPEERVDGCLCLEWHLQDVEKMEKDLSVVFSQDTLIFTWGRWLWHDGADPRPWTWRKEDGVTKRVLEGGKFYTAASKLIECYNMSGDYFFPNG